MTGLQHDDHVVFVDRNSGGKVFRDHIVASGIKVVLHDEHFGPSVRGIKSPPDEHWLVTIGKLGWLIVTGDTRTIKEPLFLRNIPGSNAYVFLLSDLNGGGPEDRARVVVNAFPKMVEAVQTAQRPAIWTVKNNSFTSFDWRARLQKYHAYGRIQ